MAAERPADEIANELRNRIDRLINLAEAKFEYVLDLQGDPIRDLRDTATLTKVVNVHATLLAELVRTVGVVGVVAAASFKTGAKLGDNIDKLVDVIDRLIDRYAEVDEAVTQLDHAVDLVARDLVDVIKDVDDRTLVLPDTPEGV